MKQGNGLAAGLVAVVAILGLSNLSYRPSESAPSTQPGRSRIPSASAESTNMGELSYADRLFLPCAEIRQRLERFIQEPVTIDSWKLPDSCYELGKAPARPERVHTFPDVQFAVAIVPNPVATHLPLLFDRLVEAIQQAVQDENYNYDSSWFPWDPLNESYPSLDDQLAAAELQKVKQAQPGVMVFRHAVPNPAEKDDATRPYEVGLVIFLVAEQPTGGVSDDEFGNAIAWIRNFAGSVQSLRILGPTFSGSLPSLQRVLKRNLSTDSLKQVQVFSGTVNSDASVHWFAHWMQKQGTRVPFKTALQNDSLMVSRFCQYLRDDEGYKLRHVAVLSEDQTAYGRGSGPASIDPSQGQPSTPPQGEEPECGHAVRLYYPRDIAILRSAYEQQSILSAYKPPSNANAPSTTLRADLSEAASSEHDAVRSYGGQLTPLAQESILLAIGQLLKKHRVQFIILRSTNSLDQIFLAEYFRQADPGVRVVIDGADLLFVRGSEGRSLRGVMLLSTYPLLTSQMDWTSPPVDFGSRGYRRFGEDLSEGMYVAARQLINPGGAIDDYAPPHWLVDSADGRVPTNLPVTWVTVIGHGQLWPTAALWEHDAQPNILKPLPGPDDGRAAPDHEAYPLRLPTIMWLLLVGCLAWSAAHLYFSWQGSITGSVRARSYFAPTPRWQHPALIALGSLFLAMCGVLVAAASGLLSRYQAVWSRSVVGVWILLVIGSSAFACVKNYKLDVLDAEPPAEKSDIRRWRQYASGLAVLSLAIFAFIHLTLISKLKAINSLPAYWRSVNLLSGVSPLLPQVLLILGMYLWFWFNLRGLAHFGEDRPRLPSQEDLPKLEDHTPVMAMFGREGAGYPTEKAGLPLTQQYCLILLAVFLTAVGLGAVALGGPWLRTLGERAFGVMIFFWMCVCIALILTDAIQLSLLWSKLRNLLIFLDRLPLRRTLWALKGISWKSIWRMSGNVLDERYRMISRQFESLTHVENALTAWKAESPSAEESRRDVLTNIEQLRSKREEFAEWYVAYMRYVDPKKDRHSNSSTEPPREGNRPESLAILRKTQEDLAAIAALLMRKVLLPAWRGESHSLIVLHSEQEGKALENAGDATLQSEIPLHVRAAEEFVVLPYLAFIQNILGRARTLVLGMVFLFVATTLAASSYPFEPLNTLGGIFLALFVIVGGLIVIVYAQMRRDATLSHITSTRPGELGIDFWLRLAGFGIGPLLGLLTTLFPSITDFVFSWLEPGTQAFK